MLTTIRNGAGDIQAVCEWWPVDVNGTWNPNGVAIWVNQLEINPSNDNRTRMIHIIIQDIASRCPWAKGAYWERRDRWTDRKHWFTRKQLVREEVTV